MSAVLNRKLETTTDITHGQPLVARVLARTDELEDALAFCGASELLRRSSLQAALVTAHALIAQGQAATGSLSAWLERNKHLG